MELSFCAQVVHKLLLLRLDLTRHNNTQMDPIDPCHTDQMSFALLNCRCMSRFITVSSDIVGSTDAECRWVLLISGPFLLSHCIERKHGLVPETRQVEK